MSCFDPINHLAKREKVDFIVPERIREGVNARGYTYEEAAYKCDIPSKEFGVIANGHKKCPNEYIFNLQKGLKFPKSFFYFIRWERT